MGAFVRDTSVITNKSTYDLQRIVKEAEEEIALKIEQKKNEYKNKREGTL